MATRFGTPLDIPSKTVPQYYFDPSVTSATDPKYASGRFQSRADLSGNGLTATCPDGENSAPSPVANGIGNLTTIAYNKTSAYDLVYVVNKGEVLTAAGIFVATNSNDYSRLMSIAQKLGGGADWNTVTGFDLEIVNGQSKIALQRAQQLTPQGAFTPNVPFFVVCQFDGAKSYLYINGNFIGSANTSGIFDISSSTFGLSNTRGNGFIGQCGTQLLWDKYLNTADRQYFEGTEMWKWDGGVAGPMVNAMPADHPWKNQRPTVSDGGAGDTPVSLSDTLSATDSSTSRAAVAVATTDTGSLVDAATARAGVAASTSDTVTLTDTATVRVNIPAAASDTATLSDTPTTSLGAAVNVTDAGVLTEALGVTVAAPAATSDALSLTDAATAGAEARPAVSDVLVLSETVAPSVAAVAASADTVALVEGGAGPAVRAVVTLAEAATPSDTATAASSNAGNAGQADSGTLTDTQGARAAAVVSAADSVALLDAVGVVARAAVAAADVEPVSDALSYSVDVRIGASDTATLTEAAPPTAGARSGVQDAGAFADLSTVTGNARATLVDVWNYTEANTYAVSLPVGSLLADSASLLDVVSVRVGIVVAAADVLTVQEAFPPRSGVSLRTGDVLSVFDRYSFSTGAWFPIDGNVSSPWRSVELDADGWQTLPDLPNA